MYVLSVVCTVLCANDICYLNVVSIVHGSTKNRMAKMPSVLTHVVQARVYVLCQRLHRFTSILGLSELHGQSQSIS